MKRNKERKDLPRTGWTKGKSYQNERVEGELRKWLSNGTEKWGRTEMNHSAAIRIWMKWGHCWGHNKWPLDESRGTVIRRSAAHSKCKHNDWLADWLIEKVMWNSSRNVINLSARHFQGKAKIQNAAWGYELFEAFCCSSRAIFEGSFFKTKIR